MEGKCFGWRHERLRDSVFGVRQACAALDKGWQGVMASLKPSPAANDSKRWEACRLGLIRELTPPANAGNSSSRYRVRFLVGAWKDAAPWTLGVSRSGSKNMKRTLGMALHPRQAPNFARSNPSNQVQSTSTTPPLQNFSHCSASCAASCSMH